MCFVITLTMSRTLAVLGKLGCTVTLGTRHFQGPTPAIHQLELGMSIVCSALAIFLPPARKEENALGVPQGMKTTALGHG